MVPMQHHSTQFSFWFAYLIRDRLKMVAGAGIEPASQAYEARKEPPPLTRNCVTLFDRQIGLEPTHCQR